MSMSPSSISIQILNLLSDYKTSVLTTGNLFLYLGNFSFNNTNFIDKLYTNGILI